MQKYVNTTSVPLSLAVYLATDHYDHDDSTISVTGLIKPIRQSILSSRMKNIAEGETTLIEIGNMLASRNGTAIHTGIENAWLNNYQNAMLALGYKQRVIDLVKINPKPEELTEDTIAVYMERRSIKEVSGERVSGKFDFVMQGRLEDFKNVTAYSLMSGSKSKDYILQGSVYRWLNQDIITDDFMVIQAIVTDWNSMQAKQNSKYPQSRILSLNYELMPVAETEQWVKNRIAQIHKYKDAPEADIPYCTDEELWRKEPVFKYYKNPEKTNRSTKNFDTKQEAYIQLAQDGNVGIVKEVPGQVTACKYCPALLMCSQAAELVACGDLVI